MVLSRPPFQSSVVFVQKLAQDRQDMGRKCQQVLRLLLN